MSLVHIEGDDQKGCNTVGVGGGDHEGPSKSVSVTVPLLYFKCPCVVESISVTPPTFKEPVEEEKPSHRRRGGDMELCSSFPTPWPWGLTLTSCELGFSDTLWQLASLHGGT